MYKVQVYRGNNAWNILEAVAYADYEEAVDAAVSLVRDGWASDVRILHNHIIIWSS